MPAWVGQRMIPPDGRPRVIKSQDIRADNWRMFEKGYAMVGFAKFDGPPADVGQAVRQARAAGAEVVVVQEKFAKSLTETVAVTQWPSDERTEIREQSSTYGGRRGARQQTRTTEVRVTRSPETVYMPRQVDYYEHSATFWRRIENPLFGALVADLSDAQKQDLQTNRGLVVRAVMIDSPAFQADLLRGDILLRMNGEPVPSSQRFYSEIIDLAGKEVTFTLLRGKTEIDRRLRFNP